MANRTPLMAGNWKMNLNHVEATGLVQKLAWTLVDHKYNPATTGVAVIVPFTDIRTVQTLIEAEKYPIAWGAQDVSAHASGAYTGEISADMLAKLGCTYVVVGHSERRQYHAETDEVINAKAKAVIAAGMTPIICCGEVLEIRKAGTHVAHVLGQVTACLEGLTAEQVGALVIAYEPVWAIGTGRTASPEEAQAVHAMLRARLARSAASEVSLLYGGSVKADNAKALFAMADIDGGLIGGASLRSAEFLAIARA
jgi:triosephosphate isomerase